MKIVWTLAILVRLGILFLAIHHPSRTIVGDSALYLHPSQDPLYRLPAYPVFLAITGKYAIPLQIFLSLVTAWIFWRMTHNKIATGFFALDPVIIMFTGLILSETLALFFAVAALSQTETRKPIVSGLLWSLLLMTRPMYLYLPAVLAPLWRRRACVLFLCASYALPLAWTIRNHGTFTSQSHGSVVDFVKDRSKSLGAKQPFGFMVRMVFKTFADSGVDLLARWTTGKNFSKSASPRISGSGTVQILKRFHWMIIPFCIYMASLLTLYILSLRGMKGYLLWACALYLGFMASLGIGGSYRMRIPLMPILCMAIQ